MFTFFRLFRDANTVDGLGAAGTASAIAGAIETGVGIIDKIGARKRQKRLLNQRKAYQTPQEITDILNATEYNAQTGYDPVTLDYLTDETNSAFSSSIGAVERLGGDPNMLSQIFGQNVDNIRRISADNHNLYMQNFSQYLSALNTVGENKTAEWQSQQDIIKDKLQAAGLDIQSATANISGGLNTVLSTLSAEQIAQLYNPDGTPKNKTKLTPYRPTQAGSILPDNGLPMGG